MIKREKEEPYEIFLENSPRDEEETLWVSGRASLEEILTSEGLTIVSLFSLDDFVEKKRVKTLCP